MKESSVYIHIPFCDHKCIYCDFYSIITKDNINNYLNAITKEINYYSKEYSDDRIIKTIFFGGGTPSLMQPEYLGEIIYNLKKYFLVSGDVELTIETNPGTITKTKLKKFREVGFNRISIGVQSFNNDELKFLTRIHNKETALSAIQDASEVGFDNINIDLIFNLPGQTKSRWLSNLKITTLLPITHISAYSLILEKGTILNKMVLDRKIKISDSDYDADLYFITMDYLKLNGFIQYEVSNFSLPGYECRHNNAYWHYSDYLSFGTSAHSFLNERRWWNYSSVKRYIVEITNCGKAVASYEQLTKEQMIEEYVMLALRSSGLNLDNLRTRFGDGWISKNIEKIKFYEQENLLIVNKNLVKLTEKGYALCDKILEEIL